MKNILYLLVFFVSFSVFAQHKAFEITNIRTNKVKVFEENQRVKVRTLDGKKHVGNLQFSDNQTLLINNESIQMDSISSIKNQPKIFGTVKTVVLITGLAIVGTSVIVATGGGNAALLLFTVGSGVTLSAGIIEAINANNSKKQWAFKIIEK